jgi:predicted nucleic acid-binding protein
VITIDANMFLRTLAAHQADHMTCRTLLERLQALAIPIIVPSQV